MKKILLGLFLLVSVGLTAQMSIDPSVINVEDVATTSDIQIDFTVENLDAANSSTFLWRILEPENFPSEWHVHICDVVTCWFHTIHTCPDTDPNMLAAGASFVFQFHVNPRDQEAEHVFTFELFDVNDPTNVLSSTEITVSTLSSSTSDEDLTSGITIYPNPTTEYFQIMDDAAVNTVAIYNIVGKQINKFDHDAGQLYYVNNLRKGMYLVRLFDESGNAIKALRLSKE